MSVPKAIITVQSYMMLYYHHRKTKHQYTSRSVVTRNSPPSVAYTVTERFQIGQHKRFSVGLPVCTYQDVKTLPDTDSHSLRLRFPSISRYNFVNPGANSGQTHAWGIQRSERGLSHDSPARMLSTAFAADCFASTAHETASATALQSVVKRADVRVNPEAAKCP